MAILIFRDQALLDEIGISPAIEGGIGAVLVGQCAVTAESGEVTTYRADSVRAVDGRVAISHGFSDIDLDWFTAYTQGDSPTVVIIRDAWVSRTTPTPMGDITITEFVPARLPVDFVLPAVLP
jgi:hypothetical protein